MNKCIFIDRDGTLNIEKDYLYKIEDFKFIDSIFETCKYFQKNNYLIFIITNQSGIARGFYSKNDFEILTNWMIKEFKKRDIKIKKVYYCPHHPDIDGMCLCRKPNPQMILDAKYVFYLDLENSIFIGDKNSDIETGINAGIKHNFLISTGHKIDTNQFNVEILNNLKELIDKNITICNKN